MSHCDACEKDGGNSFSIQVHSFPEDPQLCKKWIHAVQNVIEGWTPKESSVICSKHFEDSCYKEPDPMLGRIGSMCRALNDDAVPTIFKTSRNAKKIDLGKSHQESQRLKSSERQEQSSMDLQEACDREMDTSKTKQVEELGLSTNPHHRTNGEMDVDVVGPTDDDVQAEKHNTTVQKSYKNQPVVPVMLKRHVEKRNPVFFEGDLNLPLKKVFEQITSIEESRANKVLIDEGRRKGEYRWWSSSSQDFRTKFDTYMHRLERKGSNIPVTFDPMTPSTLSILGDSEETIRLKQNLSVPCLGELFCTESPLCPYCGSVLVNMTRVVRHTCKFKRIAREAFVKSNVPDVVLVKDTKWTKLQKTAFGKPKKKTVIDKLPVTTGLTGLVDVLDIFQENKNRLFDGLSITEKEEPKATVKRRKNYNVWKKLRMKHKANPPPPSPSPSKKGSPVKNEKMRKKKKKKKKKKEKKEGNLTSQSTVLGESIADTRKEEDKNRFTINSIQLIDGSNSDLLFADLQNLGLVMAESGNLGSKSSKDHSDNQTMANDVAPNPVYPVSIMPSSLLLTNMNSASSPENNEPVDSKENVFRDASRMGAFPDQALTIPVKCEKDAVKCPKCDFWCDSEKELEWHQCLDSQCAPPGGLDVGGGGGGGGITLSDGTFIKAEPMDYR
ncbi:uncharacterized protein LOC129261122 [Lytechinus pictus]|uniref:uncharacterized protein LOC129261122 n=1 Tax=Lytechinus pictus TaxID=7653 RepID=UPI0030B9CD5D